MKYRYSRVDRCLCYWHIHNSYPLRKKKPVKKLPILYESGVGTCQLCMIKHGIIVHRKEGKNWKYMFILRRKWELAQVSPYFWSNLQLFVCLFVFYINFKNVQISGSVRLPGLRTVLKTVNTEKFLNILKMYSIMIKKMFIITWHHFSGTLQLVFCCCFLHMYLSS